jgi:hypothetical protein
MQRDGNWIVPISGGQESRGGCFDFYRYIKGRKCPSVAVVGYTDESNILLLLIELR